MTDWADVGVTAGITVALGAAGLYLAHSVRRRTNQQIQLNVADKRFAAYAALWAETKAAPGMHTLTGEGPLKPDERRRLADRLTEWYYDNGNGMLLSEETRKVFLEAKHNLIRPVELLTPKSRQRKIEASSEAERDGLWGEASLQQISLLRNAMRADFAVYTSPAGAKRMRKGLTSEDREFLLDCGVDLNRRPWRTSRRERLQSLPDALRRGPLRRSRLVQTRGNQEDA
jgi:hypothetical protein